MEKRVNKYRITLEQLSSAKPDAELNGPTQLEFDNHDEIFSIIKRLQEKDHFNNKNQSAEFALGLKLFSEVMIKNKENPLFEEFFPAFRAFMQKLKSS